MMSGFSSDVAAAICSLTAHATNASRLARLCGPTTRRALAFAEAFAGAWEAFNTDRHFHMVPVHVAYRRWNQTGGLTVFPLYATTIAVAS